MILHSFISSRINFSSIAFRVVPCLIQRFEVQIEVPKPRTVEQRVSILRVHTESMVNNGRVLVKDAPEGTAAWKRLRVSSDMAFVHIK